mmetsp:Transcript_9222/g.6995  ORF Transcript_9222/g.6995 Transcript_9222/m.6995 type:complete len:200 (-) Transcript_9222:352-951(-)
MNFMLFLAGILVMIFIVNFLLDIDHLLMIMLLMMLSLLLVLLWLLLSFYLFDFLCRSFGRSLFLFIHKLLFINLLRNGKVLLWLLFGLDLGSISAEPTLILIGVGSKVHLRLWLPQRGLHLRRIPSFGSHFHLQLVLSGFLHSFHDFIHAFDVVCFTLAILLVACFEVWPESAFFFLNFKIIVVARFVLFFLILSLWHS